MRIMHLSRIASMFTKFLIPVIEAQKKLGHSVSLCATTSDEIKQLRAAGFEVFTHNMKRSLNPFGILRAALRIRRILIEQQIEVTISHNALCASRIAAWLANVPCIINFCHGMPFGPFQNAFSWQLRYWGEKLHGYITDAVLVMNDYDEKFTRTHHLVKNTDKIFRIPGVGVDLNQYSMKGSKEAKQKLATELSIAEDAKIVLCVARLIPEKGVFVLVEAARKICAKRDDVCFLLAGKGPSMDKLKKTIKRNHLNHNFRLLGYRDDVSILLKAADIFTLPTYYIEGIPVSILEAMACGKATVVTQNRGCEDIVTNGQTGFLVPIKQATALADKILLLLDNEQLRIQIGHAARQWMEQHFELGYCTEIIVEALEKAIR